MTPRPADAESFHSVADDVPSIFSRRFRKYDTRGHEARDAS